MYKGTIKLHRQTKGVVGEIYLTMRLLLLGHDVANTNFTVKNTANYDLLCRKNGEGKAYPLQVKTTFSDAWRVGMTHADFITNGKFDEVKGRKNTEAKVQCSWAFLLVDGNELKPDITIFILTRQQVIDLIVTSEYWYLTDNGRIDPNVSEKGDVGLTKTWIMGDAGKSTGKHNNVYQNPLAGITLVDNWDNIWKD